MADKQYDLVVIGAGPGGYVAAIRAAQLGMSVAVIDKRKTPGGTCLNVGCIPSKALLNASHKYHEAKETNERFGITAKSVTMDIKKMLSHKDGVVSELTKGIGFLFKKNKVDFIVGTAKIEDAQTVKVAESKSKSSTVKGKRILIAAGSVPAMLPNIKVDEKRIVSSTGALELQKVPKHMVVVGAGYIGLELGSVWARLGAKVTVVEAFSKIAPTMDEEVGKELQKTLEKQGFKFKFDRKLVKVVEGKKDLTLHVLPTDLGEDSNKAPESISCDVLLMSIGRKPALDGLGIEHLGIQTNDRGYIMVNENFETSCPGVYAIGDAIPGPMLAHKAEDEGVVAVERMSGMKSQVNHHVIPGVIYTYPEVASVGKTEQELKAEGTDYKVGKFPFMANSRAKTISETTGFAKILTDKQTDRVLGCHIIADVAGTLIAEVALAMEFNASAEDIARTCHAHPTHNEAVKEAALAAYDKAIHI